MPLFAPSTVCTLLDCRPVHVEFLGTSSAANLVRILLFVPILFGGLETQREVQALISIDASRTGQYDIALALRFSMLTFEDIRVSLPLTLSVPVRNQSELGDLPDVLG